MADSMTTAEAPAASAMRTVSVGSVLVTVGRGLSVCALPIIVGLWMAATNFIGGTFVPWRPLMVDLDVYRRAGAALLDGSDFYALPGPLPFLYPPFAAVLAVPLAILPGVLIEIAWSIAGVLALLAVLHRFGLRGWQLSLVGTATIYFVDPISETLAFGQPGIFLMALVILDLVPGPRVLSRRILPTGVLTAIAAALKLTPAIFVLYLIAIRQWRAAVTAIVTGLAVTLGTLVIVPGPSIRFWSRLAQGDTGLGHSLIYFTNQSVMADAVRILGLGPGSAFVGLAASAVVALLGVWAGMLWHHIGEVGLAVTLVGVAGLLASPVSWLHHFVWVVPLAMCLIWRTPGYLRRPALPSGFLIVGWLFVGWVVAQLPMVPAPLRRLPNGADLELQWTWWQHALASITAVLGVIFLVVCVVVAQRLGRSPVTSRPVVDTADQGVDRMLQNPISTADHHKA
jgi:alpha-1,2-mannosyltransferase